MYSSSVYAMCSRGLTISVHEMCNHRPLINGAKLINSETEGGCYISVDDYK